MGSPAGGPHDGSPWHAFSTPSRGSEPRWRVTKCTRAHRPRSPGLSVGDVSGTCQAGYTSAQPPRRTIEPWSIGLTRTEPGRTLAPTCAACGDIDWLAGI